MRYCEICGESFEHVGTKPRLTCSESCRAERIRRRQRIRYRANKRPPAPRAKVCVVCGVEFQAVGRQRLCGDVCRRERIVQQTRERYWRTSSEERRASLRRRRLRYYGLTEDDWNRMFVAQGCVCAACGTPDSGRYWHTDHCHATGKVRGVLCHACNSALGMLRDSRERIAALDAYLVRTT